MGGRCVRAVLAMALLLLPGAGWAGAWPREEGQTFLSFSHALAAPRGDWGTAGFDPATWTALYLEHGVGAGLTFGLDAGRSNDGTSTVIAFASVALGQGAGGGRWAAQLGVGGTGPEGPDRPLVQLMANWGRGGERGWLAADGQVQLVRDAPAIAKLDLTWGIHAGDRTRVILQLQTGDYPGSPPYARLHPAVVLGLNDTLSVEIGAELGLAGSDSLGLKLGTWLEF